MANPDWMQLAIAAVGSSVLTKIGTSLLERGPKAEVKLRADLQQYNATLQATNERQQSLIDALQVQNRERIQENILCEKRTALLEMQIDRLTNALAPMMDLPQIIQSSVAVAIVQSSDNAISS